MKFPTITPATERVLKVVMPYLDRREPFDIVNVIAPRLGITRSAVDHHLDKMVSAGFLKRPKRGAFEWSRRPSARDLPPEVAHVSRA